MDDNFASTFKDLKGDIALFPHLPTQPSIAFGGWASRMILYLVEHIGGAGYGWAYRRHET